MAGIAYGLGCFHRIPWRALRQGSQMPWLIAGLMGSSGGLVDVGNVEIGDGTPRGVRRSSLVDRQRLRAGDI